MTDLRRRHKIAFCCDFFYPRLGGVEMHLWSLAQCLLERGHEVIVITHATENRTGIRYMTNLLKVYYIPLLPFVDHVIFPTFIGSFELFRNILIRERISIVHGHQATSTMMHECFLQARTLGYHVVYTDHSLFGFKDAASIHLNKVMKFTCSDIDHAIAVSHTCRENLVLRASIIPTNVSTIPNAVDTTKFTPDLTRTGYVQGERLVVVIVSRLVYRKGIDLVVKAIPLIVKRIPNILFVIGGDGDKKILLEEMIEEHRIDRHVELLGALSHETVRSVLTRGHIFLNSSLTESFCIAILEAASCGLFIVSTRVGGVPEVLPPDMIQYADTTPEGLADAIAAAVPRLAGVNPKVFHERIGEMYDWRDVARRTEIVYDLVRQRPKLALIDRLHRYYGVGPISGIISCFIVAIMYLYSQYLEWAVPKHTVELARERPAYVLLQARLRKLAESSEDGNHDLVNEKKKKKKDDILM